MVIAGIVKTSLIDYPGRISCVLFTPGCNYNCYYCHNRSLIEGSHDILSIDDVFAFLKKRIEILEGVVITGGEPSLQKDLFPFIRTLRAMGYQIKLDTNGSAPDIVSRLLADALCDYYAVDYKAPADRYEEICGKGASAVPVLETIRMLKDSALPFEVRTTAIPQLKENDLLRMAQELPPLLPKYVLNHYRKPEYFLSGDRQRIEETPYTPAEIAGFAHSVRTYQPNITT